VRTLLLALVLATAGTALAAAPRGTGAPDRIDTVNGQRDMVRCGAGRDIVVADLKDVVARDCETVTRRIALDTTTEVAAQHRAIVEPSAAAEGGRVVTVFQSGRYPDGGAAAIGWATTADGGTNWRHGVLVGGGANRVSDPVVVRDTVHGTWLAAVLLVMPAQTQILVFRSPDGLTWSQPVAAVTEPPRLPTTIGLDKEWLACDGRTGSAHLGTCYLAYTDVAQGHLAAQASSDGGATWSAPVSIGTPSGDGPVAATPAVLPNGTLVVVYASPDLSELDAVSSTDGGATFSAPVGIAAISSQSPLLRAPPLPSVAETTNGIAVVWPDCSAHAGCAANDILLAQSSDGTTWSAPRTIAAGGDYLTPTIGASGDAVAILAYVRLDPICCRIGIRLFRSADGGATWSTPRRLDATPMHIPWLARSISDGSGGFLGDYEAVAFVGSRPMPVFASALAPAFPGLRQDLYATTRLS
jgi:hypothetical protein